MTSLNEKLIVIIRSIGERTEHLCRELILAQGINIENVLTVKEKPFSSALRKSLLLGIERKKPWTYCIDADVLLRHGAIDHIVKIAELQKKNVCEIQGFVLDKLFGGLRTAGNHLYRTSLIPEIIKEIPTGSNNIRPETHALDKMLTNGFPWKNVPYVVGLHDFEQYYHDIFKKCFFHAQKHIKYADLFLKFWLDKAIYDRDYLVALKGFTAGIENYNNAYQDFSGDLGNELSKNLINEKNDTLSINDFSLDTVEEKIINWVEPKVYKIKFPEKAGYISQASVRTKIQYIYQAVQEPNRVLKVLIYLKGWFLSRIGAFLLSLAKGGDGN